jgi:hypothetical protein
LSRFFEIIRKYKAQKSLSIRKGFFAVGGPDDPASGGRTRLAFGEMPGIYSNSISCRLDKCFQVLWITSFELFLYNQSFSLRIKFLQKD